MTIEVVYENGTKGRVTAEMLNFLLEANSVITFKRGNGWVRPGCDQLRSRDKVVFSIPERREAMNSLLASDPQLPVV